MTEDIEFFKQVFGGAWITQGLWVAAELGIADLLAQRPQTASELASRTHAHGGALYRVLRALASVGVFMEDAQGRFSLTPRANLLRSDMAGSQRAVAAMMGAEFHETWGVLLHSAQTGEPGFKSRYGTSFFQYMEKHPDRHAIYDAAMTGIHSAETEPVLAAYCFDAFRMVVDVGGGNGLTLAAILNRYSA
ncbi:MAG: methyltransferase, partial [Candidatus Brocadiaceae bacterium]|nr:methyltransferase [Candidatus Brocadiaceae bacterium]